MRSGVEIPLIIELCVQCLLLTDVSHSQCPSVQARPGYSTNALLLHASVDEIGQPAYEVLNEAASNHSIRLSRCGNSCR
jgi:hypothetical protein